MKFLADAGISPKTVEALLSEGHEAVHIRALGMHRADDRDIPGRYLWSNFHANADGESDELVTEHEVYSRLGSDAPARQAAYRQLFRSALGETAVERIRGATNKGWALGNERFREQIEALSGRRAAQKPKGRPRREE